MNGPAFGRTRDWQSFLQIAIVAAIAVSPLAIWGPSCGHDFDFHLVSWLEILHSWHAGIFYPHWAVSPNYGAGEARFVFYPPLTWMLGGALGTMLPWTWTPQVFTFLAFVFCGISMRALAREWLTNNMAVFAASLYIVSPYLLFNAYERGAYGELIGAAWLPLIILFALRRRSSSAWLAIAIAGIWLTNAPSAVIGEYLLVVVAGMAALLERTWWPLARAAWAQVLGLGLASFYVLPGAYERRWVAIREAIGPGMRVEDSWLFGHTGEPFHDQVLHTASLIGVCLLLAGAIGGVMARHRVNRENRRWLLPMMLLIPTMLFLLLPVSDFLWRHAPEMKFLQFPWRWLLVASLVASALLATALKNSLLGYANWLLLPLLAVLAVSASFKTLHLYQVCDEEDALTSQVQLFHSGRGVEGTDEYASLGADNTAIQRSLPEVRVLQGADEDATEADQENPQWSASKAKPMRAAVDVKLWQPENKQIEVDSQQPGFAVLRLREYPAWSVQVNGHEVAFRPRRLDGLVTIPISAGHSQIKIKWGTTPDVLWGRVLSGLAMFGILGTLLWRQRQVS
jgi:hypothetical protein